MERKYILIDTEIKDHYVRLVWWQVTTWYRYFGWKGILSWCFSFMKLKGAYFEYNGKEQLIEKPGFQMCLFGFQFGWLYKYND